VKLVGVSAKPEKIGEGATGWASTWKGELGIQLDDGTVVTPGIQLSFSAWSDYSNSYSRSDRIDLIALESGWLLRVYVIFSEMFVADETTELARWLGSADGRSWQRVSEKEPAPQGTVVGTLTTPPSAKEMVLSAHKS
jgi:hypothetical protein